MTILVADDNAFSRELMRELAGTIGPRDSGSSQRPRCTGPDSRVRT